jgi:hypothetical protein
MIKKFSSACLLLSLVFAQEGTHHLILIMELEMLDLKEQLKIVLWLVLAVEQDSIHINCKILQVLLIKMTTFALGGTYNTTTLKSDTRRKCTKRTTLIMVGLPFGKLGVGLD